MSFPIRRQAFMVEVTASIMPRMTETELQDAVARLAVEKESTYGMGALQISVRELIDNDTGEWRE